MSVLAELQEAVAAVATAVGPSVVGIGSRSAAPASSSRDGRVLTNAHNLRGREVTVRFADGRTTRGTVSGVDWDGDLAVVEVDTADDHADRLVDRRRHDRLRGVRGRRHAVRRRARLVRVRLVRGAGLPRPGRPPDLGLARAHGAAGPGLVRVAAARRRRRARRAQHEPGGRGLLPRAPGRRGRSRPAWTPSPAASRASGRAWASRWRRRTSRVGCGGPSGLPERDGVLVRGVEDGSPAEAAGHRRGRPARRGRRPAGRRRGRAPRDPARRRVPARADARPRRGGADRHGRGAATAGRDGRRRRRPRAAVDGPPGTTRSATLAAGPAPAAVSSRAPPRRSRS